MPRIAPAPIPDGSSVMNLVTAADKAEASALVGRAFAGTESRDPEGMFHWALGPTVADRSELQRADCVAYTLGAEILSRTGAHLVGVRDAEKLQAVLLFWRSPGGPKGSSISMCSMISFYMKAKTPPLFKPIQSAVTARLMNADKVMKASHTTHAPGPHYYMSVIAVDPEAQDKKFGSKLINYMSGLADGEGLPCYLECSGATRRDMYAHFGYEEKACMSVGAGIKKDEAINYEPYKEFYAMVRPAKS